MNKIKCIVIDDEPAAIEIIDSYISEVPFLELVNKFTNPIDAAVFIENDKIDLMFLDIRIPEINGLQFLSSLNSPPLVIITTAYKDYAIESYEHGVIDYLLKPFDFNRFFKAVNKATHYISKIQGNNTYSQGKQKYIFVKSDYKLVKINVDDIIFVEGLKDYIKIYTKNKLILTLMSMSNIEAKLPGDDFFRIHRSYIISLNKIDFISRHRVIMGEKFIPVSLPYRERFYKIIDRAL